MNRAQQASDSKDHPTSANTVVHLCMLLVAWLLLSSYACASEMPSSATLGLPAIHHQSRSSSTIECVNLGRRLFNDRTLSSDGRLGCVSCHDPAKGLADGLPVATGVGGQHGARNAPSLWNVAWQRSLFWDGRIQELEAQALRPLLNPVEQGFRSEAELVSAISLRSEYLNEFARVFPSSKPAISANNVGKALACFERTLVAAGSPFDRYQYGGEISAMSAGAIRGFEIFRGRAGCAECHRIGTASAMLADGRFHRRGIGFVQVSENLPETVAHVMKINASGQDQLIIGSQEVAQLGRFVVSRDPKDIGSFKTPSLRNVALTAPYMHDGSVATLEQAIIFEAYYGKGDGASPIMLSAREVDDIAEFLRSLTGPSAATSNTLPEVKQ